MRNIKYPRSRVPKGNIRFIYTDQEGNTVICQTTGASEADFFTRMIDSSFRTNLRKRTKPAPIEDITPDDRYNQSQHNQPVSHMSEASQA